MSDKIRVVIADDSPFIRRIVCSHLESSDEFEVVGAAEDGRRAVELVQELRPDVLTLDVDMPNMSGIEALEEIMRVSPTPIVMVSGVSLGAAATTQRAIESGAIDFVLKYVPGAKINPDELRLDIISKVRAAAGIHVVRTISRQRSQRSDSTTISDRERSVGPIAIRQSPAADLLQRHPQNPGAERPTNEQRGVVVIGASTGGPVALKSLLSNLPLDFCAPIIIVQHIPPPFASVLATQLNCQLPFHTCVAEGGEQLRPRHIYIAPGDQHLLLDERLRLSIRGGPPISGHRPSIDVTMKSVAQALRNSVYGILMTGMGTDGASGLQFIKSQGGQTFAQDSNSCVVDGMPQSAVRLNAVDHVASPAGIADRLYLEFMRRETQQISAQQQMLPQ